MRNNIQCKTCKEEFPANNFYKYKNGSLIKQCKKCYGEYKKSLRTAEKSEIVETFDIIKEATGIDISEAKNLLKNYTMTEIINYYKTGILSDLIKINHI